MHFTEQPFDWSDWCRERFGGDFIGELREVAQGSVKWYKKQRDEIHKHMQGELAKMQHKRADGDVSYLDFEPHELMHKFENAP